MTTCKLEKRTYVPSGWIALEFCTLHFYGKNKEKYEELWDNIEHYKYIKYEKEYNKLKKDLKEIEKNKKWYQFTSKIEKEKREKLISLNKLMKNDIYDLIVKAETMLEENNFYLTQHSSDGSECETETEIWTQQ